MSISIRQATAEDVPALLEIYNHYIQSTAITFEIKAPSVDEFAQRISECLKAHEYLVGVEDKQIVGYAYGNTHRSRAAYRFSVETSVYLDTNFCGRGYGKALYTQLLNNLAQLNFHNAYAGITLPNVASVAMHESLGFEPIGIFKEIGFKFDSWHDVGWWQRPLSPIK